MKKIVLLMLGLVLLTAGSSAAGSSSAETGPKLPIFSVETPGKVVSLTFNAAWDDADTEEILDILKRRGIKASFFLCGPFVSNHPEIVKRIAAEGHDVANHGNTHAHVASLSLSENKAEISDLHEKIKSLTGIDMKLYRGPYGEFNDIVVTAAENLGYKMIQWTIDSLDWQNKGAEDMVSRVLNHKNLQNGSIILLHTDAKHTASVLNRIIGGLIEKGFGFAPVSEMIYMDGYYIDIQGRQRKNLD